MNIQIILTGVGGQGILFATRIFSELGLELGLNITGSETHGMSQRGGSVVTHLKLGDFHSPMVPSGRADFLYSFEENETYRTLKFLRKGGVCFVNLLHQNKLDARILSHLEKKEVRVLACDAGSEALRIGSIRFANIVLIGYSLGTGLTPFSPKDLRRVIKSVSVGKSLKMNLEAFEAGFQQGRVTRTQKRKL